VWSAQEAADSLTYAHVTVQIDRARRNATFTVRAPQGAQPADIGAIVAAGAAWWPLQMARELDDAILHMRTNELDIGTWILKTDGDAAGVLAADAALLAHKATGSSTRPSACCAAPLRAWTSPRAACSP
jgi:benzoyl-CoA-dihydrodiol lyase